MKKLKLTCVIILAALLGAATVVNLCRTERPTVSERENRALAAFPDLTLKTFSDGSFFSGIDAYVSDTFIGRDSLVELSQKIKYFGGLDAFIPAEDDAVVFLPSETQKPPEKPVEEPVEEAPVIEPTEEEIIETEPEKTTEEEPEPEITEPPETTEPEPEPLIPDEPEPPTEQETTVPPEKPEKPTPPAPEEIDHPAPTEDIETVVKADDGNEAEFLTDGYIIYHDALYSIPYLVKSVAMTYGETINRYAELFPDARVSILVAPLSSGMIESEKIRKKITDQNAMIDAMNSYCGENINKVNVYSALYAHRNEYIYYRSDHHWTARGAYYAYAEFAKSVGITPVPLESMTEKLLNASWKGTAYSVTGDERVKDFTDEVYAYLPTKENTMTIYYKDGSSTKVNSCIRTSYKGYTAFLDGDNPYTVINVPENPKDMTALVIKDSYGLAFVPYLCEHYSTIIVADPRHITFNLYELLKDYPIRDIVFMTNIFNPSVKSWVRNVNRIIGQ